MSNEILNTLLKEYEQKKFKAEYDADKRKENLYEKEPRLMEIEDELNHFAILTAKNILQNSDYSYSELQNKIKNLKEEKNKILSSLNLSENYLKPFYECNYKTTMCNCLKQRLLNYSFNKSNIYNLEKENFNNFNENIFSDEVDISKFNFNISPRKNIVNIKNKCIDFVKNFDDQSQKNLLFVGNTGLR